MIKQRKWICFWMELVLTSVWHHCQSIFQIFLLVSFSSIGESKLNVECVFVEEVDLMDFSSVLLVMVLYECIATMKFTVLFNHFSRCI